MQQPCQSCGYISDRPARFCRQCGAQLINENEATSAPTRNYAPNQPPQTSPDQPYSPQSGAAGGWNQQPPETTRFYQPPAVQNYEAPPQKKTRWALWLLIGLLSFFVIGGSIAGILISTIRARQPYGDLVRDIERDVEEQVRRAQEQAREAEERAREAAEQARESGGAPPAPPPPPAPGKDLPAGLEKYTYPEAEVEQSINVIGNEIVKMATTDNVSRVAEFYIKVAGQPTIKTKEDEGEKYIFQVQGPPSTIITVSPDEANAGKTQIVVLRSNYKIPKFN